MRNVLGTTCGLLFLFGMSGCAHINFDEDTSAHGVEYFAPVPYLAVDWKQDCTGTASVLVLPGKARMLTFSNGYGTADLSVQLTNGIITQVGVKTNSSIPETITALAAYKKAAAAAAGKKPCSAQIQLYKINSDGTIATTPVEYPSPTISPSG